MKSYEFKIDDFSMHRHPQSAEEVILVEAETAEDALTILRVNHNVPAKANDGHGNVSWRRVESMRAVEKVSA